MKSKPSFKELLRKVGYKATPARLAILELLKKSRNPLSAQEIIALLPHEFDQATAYRTIKSLKSKGVIHQIDLRHNHAHYELTDGTEHHHLVCVRCGRIENVHQCGVDEMYASILRGSKHFLKINQHALEFYGLCKACAKKSEVVAVIAHKNAPL